MSKVIEEARNIILKAAETIVECKTLADDDVFLSALAEELNAIHESKTNKNTYIIFGVDKSGDVVLLGTSPVKASVIKECVCHVMIPVNASSIEESSLRDKTYSTLVEIAESNGKSRKEIDSIFESSINAYVADNNKKIEELTKKDWTSIAEKIVIGYILPGKTDETVELSETDIGKLIENISATKKKEAVGLLENLLKLDIDLKKRRLLDRLLKENKGEDIQ